MTIPRIAASSTPLKLTRLTAREVGTLLECSRITVYRMAKRGALPAMPIGLKGWRFFKEPLLAWQAQHLAAGTKETTNG